MSITPIKIDEATPEQRREYVRTFLNLPISATDTDTDLTAKIMQAQPGTTMIFVNEPDTAAETAAGETTPSPALMEEEAKGRQSGTLGKGDPRATIMIPVVESLDGAGTRDVLVGVNGRAWQLKRGVDLNVPYRVVEALKNASTDIVTHLQDAEHVGEVDIRTAQRFAFSLVAGPSPAEIEDWLERTGAEFCA